MSASYLKSVWRTKFRDPVHSYHGMMEACSLLPCVSLQHIFDSLDTIVRPEEEWEKLPSVDSSDWESSFEERLSVGLGLSSSDKEFFPTRALRPSGTYCCNAIKRNVKQLSLPESFEAFLNLKLLLESPLLAAKKRVTAYKKTKLSEPVRLKEVADYAGRIAGCVSAPPETSNVLDFLQHQSVYPNHHFLNMVTQQDLFNSSLWDIGRYDGVCFPPKIWLNRIEESIDTDNLQLILTCSTPGVSLYYKVNGGPRLKYAPTRPPTISASQQVTITAIAMKHNFRRSKVSELSAQATSIYQFDKNDATTSFATASSLIPAKNLQILGLNAEHASYEVKPGNAKVTDDSKMGNYGLFNA